MLPSPVYDEICRIVVRLTQSRGSILGVCGGPAIALIGRDGVDWETLPKSWSLAALATDSAELSYVANVARDPRLRGHPVRTTLPTLRRLLYIPVAGRKPDLHIGLAVFEPGLKWPLQPDISRTLTDVVQLTRTIVAEFCLHETEKNAIRTQGFGETAADHFDSSCPVGDFLFNTLVKKVTLHQAKAMTYATVRRWRKPVKSYQLAALAALKREPPAAVVEVVARELSETAVSLCGIGNIHQVTNIPCGHTKAPHCFSAAISQRVAAILDVPYVAVFERQHRIGRSHPRKNAAMPPLKLSLQPSGNVLLIDDVVTSGHHMAAAVREMRPAADHIYALAWIGDA